MNSCFNNKKMSDKEESENSLRAKCTDLQEGS